MAFELDPTAQRLAVNTYETDDGNSHIEVNQEFVAEHNLADALVRVCPARVFSHNPDGTVGVEYAACFECGTCLAALPTGALTWHYPESGMGIIFREG